uniref:metallophosphoesterase N-terminal domain-containing protein n=1 Tax=Prevotella sp. TaxID=59823 RepID=UPI004027C7A9
MRKTTLLTALATMALAMLSPVQAAAQSDTLKFTGTFTDQKGRPMRGVVVSNGFTCVQTDTKGNYKLPYNSATKFVYFTVPADCEVPTHSATDNTACFYRQVVDSVKRYDFQLTRMPRGKEKNYKLIVIGDPQVTNAYGPYFQGPNDNAVRKSDIDRFTDETMADIKKTLASLPDDMPVYALSMGDNVQYYGGYNEKLEGQMRAVLGSTRMRTFSVIGNHDQDGKALFKRKWEEAWGPTDYSFDRGNVHYVCINNVIYYRGGAYYQPGELTDEQMAWLESDLSLVPKNKMVVLSYHIPFTFGNRTLKPNPNDMGKGHYASNRLEKILLMLDKFKGYQLFCGHTHFAINNEIELNGRQVLERCHAAACGDIWQSNLNIDGVPNGYYVY